MFPKYLLLPRKNPGARFKDTPSGRDQVVSPEVYTVPHTKISPELPASSLALPKDFTALSGLLPSAESLPAGSIQNIRMYLPPVPTTAIE
jgi:hypothetical protein